MSDTPENRIQSKKTPHKSVKRGNYLADVRQANDGFPSQETQQFIPLFAL